MAHTAPGVIYFVLSAGDCKVDSSAIAQEVASLLACIRPTWRLETVEALNELGANARVTGPSLLLAAGDGELSPPSADFVACCDARMAIDWCGETRVDVYDSVYRRHGMAATSQKSGAISDVISGGEGQNSPALNFAAWLQMGIHLAEARFDARRGRQVLTDALLGFRDELATRLHNGPIQELVAGTFMGGLIPDGAGEPLLAQVQAALAQLRTLCQRLHPPVLREMGIGAAVRATVRIYQRVQPDWAPRLRVAEDLPALETRTGAILYSAFDLFLATMMTHSDDDTGATMAIQLAPASGLDEGGRAVDGSDGVLLAMNWEQAPASPALRQAMQETDLLLQQLACSGGGQVRCVWSVQAQDAARVALAFWAPALVTKPDLQTEGPEI